MRRSASFGAGFGGQKEMYSAAMIIARVGTLARYTKLEFMEVGAREVRVTDGKG